MKLRWQDFEDQVRDIATHVYGKPCVPRRLAGSNIDGVIDLSPTDLVLIEITVEHNLGKVRGDLTKLVNVRNALFLEKKFARCLIVVQQAPTQSMVDGAEANNIDILDFNQFAAQFIEYERYRIARLAYPFGSAVDAESGSIDTRAYVPVPYEDRTTGKTYSSTQVGERLMLGENFIVIGEYGSGKSRCVSQVFDHVSKEWGATFRFPVAVNLRECWGLEAADEIVRRHFTKLGLEEMKQSAVKALNRKALVFLLDGFDEIGVQSWSSEADKIREVRAQALSGVQDAVRNSGTGTLVTGREHYFSSDAEMLASLGFKKNEVTVLHVRDEFTTDELLEYFKAANIDIVLPEWLPRRPLICQTIAALPEHDRNSMFASQSDAVEFWQHFMRVVCERDSRINRSFNAETIYEVFVQLAHLTRTKSGDVGPISPRELQEAFEGVRGALPVENAAVMLQRLPSLGRIDQDSPDRRFIDTYILDGLRAVGVSRIVDLDESGKRRFIDQQWSNPLQPLGQEILGRDIAVRPGGYVNLATRAAASANRTIASDIISAVAKSQKTVDFSNIYLVDGTFSELLLDGAKLANLTLSECTIEALILPAEEISNLRVENSLIARVSGVSSQTGLPNWMVKNDVEQFDSIRTMSRIRDAGLDSAHEVLVVVLKKTFFQPGDGRKEDALLRGFESGKHTKVAKKVIASAVSYNFLDTFKGKDGLVYTPNRAMTGRAKRMLDELKSSQDPLWLAVAG